MTDPDLTYQIIIVDRSGSMASIAADTAGGLNTLVSEQAKAPGRCLVSIVEFDDMVNIVVDLAPANQVKPYRLIPRGRTALLDAIGMTIDRIGAFLADRPEIQRPGLVKVDILTDGYENASGRYTQEQIKTMIEHQRDAYGWIISFMGATEDALDVAQSYGIPSANAMHYDMHNSAMAFASASASSLRTRSAVAAGESFDSYSGSSAFTEDEKTNAATPASS